jgi:hypothetical protein
MVTRASSEAWRVKFAIVPSKTDVPRWQQFVVRAVDERNDPIEDYYLRLYTRGKNGTEQEIDGFAQRFAMTQAFAAFMSTWRS